MAVRDKFWAYVTVFGTLWGGLELTLGTFLHVLHVPKTGFIMTFLSIILLLAQRYVFPARGSTLAVGVIAACIKCLSPGGIIAGPIWGILTEAAMIELALLMSSRNILSVIFAGGLALTWSQLQSVLKMWFYYGKDFFKALIKTAEKFLYVEWTANLGWSLLIGFFVVTFILGAVAGMAGRRIGRRVLVRMDNVQENPNLQRNLMTSEWDCCGDQATDDSKHSMSVITGLSSGHRRHRVPDAQILRTRGVVCPIALVSLTAQFAIEFWSDGLVSLSDIVGIQSRWLDWTIIVPVSVLGIWLGTLALAARQVLRAIWWPKFWALTVAVSLLCGLILAWSPGESWQWQTGIEATVRMLVRGIYIFSFMGWLTRCLRAEEFLTIWRKIHLEQLGIALNGAYSLLPEWLERLNELVKSRPGGIRDNMHYAYECLLNCLSDAACKADSQAGHE